MLKTVLLFRCDAAQNVGYDSLLSCLSIAVSASRFEIGIKIVFVINEDEWAANFVGKEGFEYIIVGRDAEEKWMVDWRNNNCYESAILFFAVGNGYVDGSLLKYAKQQGYKVALFDDYSERRLEADVVFYLPTPQAYNLDWGKSACTRYIGWEWVVLGKEFVLPKKNSKSICGAKKQRKRILITMGENEQQKFVLYALNALSELEGIGYGEILWDVDVILSQVYKNSDEIKNKTEYHSNFRVHENVNELLPFLTEADLAVTVFGMSAWELAFAKVPAIILCSSEEKALMATALVYKGVACSTGYVRDHERINICIKDLMEMVLYSPGLLDNMSRKADKVIDSHAGERIVQALLMHCS